MADVDHINLHCYTQANMENELEFAPAAKIRQLVSDGEISPVELTEMFLSRIDSLDSHLNSYLTVTADRALAAARVVEWRSPRTSSWDTFIDQGFRDVCRSPHYWRLSFI